MEKLNQCYNIYRKLEGGKRILVKSFDSEAKANKFAKLLKANSFDSIYYVRKSNRNFVEVPEITEIKANVPSREKIFINHRIKSIELSR